MLYMYTQPPTHTHPPKHPHPHSHTHTHTYTQVCIYVGDLLNPQPYYALHIRVNQTETKRHHTGEIANYLQKMSKQGTRERPTWEIGETKENVREVMAHNFKIITLATLFNGIPEYNL